MYWCTNTRGAFAIQRFSTFCCGTPSLEGRSRYSGGFFGFGDHAAAVASCARRPKLSVAESAGDLTASSALSIAGLERPAARGAMQQGLIMYKLPKTSECFIPIRLAP